MRTIYIILTASIIFLLSGCYKDNGNYAYKEINTISIDSMKPKYFFLFNEKIIIKPAIKFEKEGHSNLSYVWTIDGEVVSNEKNLDVVYSNPENKSYVVGQYEVINNNDNNHYVKRFNLRFSTGFQKGWLILSKKDGKGKLSYVRNDEDKGYTIYPGIYNTTNNENLGSNPLKIVEHWNKKSSKTGNILIIQQDGNYTVDIDGSSMHKIGYTSDYFLNNIKPENYKPIDEYYLIGTSVIVNSDGSIYSRKHSDAYLYQSGKYNDTPVYLEGGFNITKIIRTPHNLTEFVLLFDSKFKRFLMFTNKGGLYTIEKTDNPEGFSDINNLQKDHVYSNSYSEDWFGSTYIFSVLKDENGYYKHNFKANVGGYISNRSEVKFQGDNLISDKSVFCALRSKPDVFFSGDINNDKIYFCSKDSDDTPLLFYDFEGKEITSIDHDQKNNTIGVGFKNGDFCIMDISIEALANKIEKLIYMHNKDLGEIIDVKYKYGSLDSFTYPTWF